MNRTITKMLLLCAAALISAPLFAGAWPYAGPSKRVTTLVVTANYERPRLIAELIQNENRQPYLLLPVAGKTEGIFFCPGRGKNSTALALKEADLTRFIGLLNPQKIIVLGDENYVPAKYIKTFPASIPVVVLKGNDWERMTKELELMIDLYHLNDDYVDLSRKLDSGSLYVPLQNGSGSTSTIPQAAKSNDTEEVVIIEN